MSAPWHAVAPWRSNATGKSAMAVCGSRSKQRTWWADMIDCPRCAVLFDALVSRGLMEVGRGGVLRMPVAVWKARRRGGGGLVKWQAKCGAIAAMEHAS